MEQSLKDLLIEMFECAEGNDISIRTDYSGRAMYGKQCIGVVGNRPLSFVIECMQNFIDMGDTEYASDFFELLKNHSEDSMGLRQITYFPSWVVEPEDQDWINELMERDE